MRQTREFIVNTLVRGLLIIVPVYFALLLLLKAMKSVWGLVRPSRFSSQTGSLLRRSYLFSSF